MSYSFVYTAVALLGIGSSVHPGLEPETMHRPAPPPPAVAAPAPEAAPAESAPTMAAPPSSATITEPRPVPVPDDGHGGFTAHLASYLGETRARQGWRLLSARAPELAAVAPHLLAADVPGHGPMIRLTAGRFATRGDAVSFCERLKTSLDYCAPLPLDP